MLRRHGPWSLAQFPPFFFSISFPLLWVISETHRGYWRVGWPLRRRDEDRMERRVRYARGCHDPAAPGPFVPSSFSGPSFSFFLFKKKLGEALSGGTGVRIMPTFISADIHSS